MLGNLLLWGVNTGELFGLSNSMNDFGFRPCCVLLWTVSSLGLGIVCRSVIEWLPGLTKPWVLSQHYAKPGVLVQVCWFVLGNPALGRCEWGSRSLRSLLLGREFGGSQRSMRSHFKQKHMLLLIQGLHSCSSGWPFLPLEKKMKFPSLGIRKARPSRTVMAPISHAVCLCKQSVL